MCHDQALGRILLAVWKELWLGEQDSTACATVRQTESKDEPSCWVSAAAPAFLRHKANGSDRSRFERDSRSAAAAAPPPFSLTPIPKASLIRSDQIPQCRAASVHIKHIGTYYTVPCSCSSLQCKAKQSKATVAAHQPTYDTNPAADCDKHYYYYYCCC